MFVHCGGSLVSPSYINTASNNSHACLFFVIPLSLQFRYAISDLMGGGLLDVNYCFFTDEARESLIDRELVECLLHVPFLLSCGYALPCQGGEAQSTSLEVLSILTEQS